MSNRTITPFREGDFVEVIGGEYLGIHRVESCEWYERGPGDENGYWLCDCWQVREPIDWSKIPEGATGIVTRSTWHGDAKYLRAAPVAMRAGQ